MSNIVNTPAMVRADAIVHTGLATVSKIIGAGAIAKATGQKTAIVKAEHYAKQGAALSLAATVTGKGRAAALAIHASQQLDAIVNPHGVIDNYRAVTTVAAILNESLTFTEALRADGQRVVKRAVWLALGETLERVATDPATGKARAKRHADALALHSAIQARADAIRESKAAQALPTVTA
jgi:hypothetical protein